MKEGWIENQKWGGGGIKGNRRKEKEREALLLSLSRLKSRISLTWMPDLSNPPPPYLPYGLPHLEHKLIDHCYRTCDASRDNIHKGARICSKSHQMHQCYSSTRDTNHHMISFQVFSVHSVMFYWHLSTSSSVYDSSYLKPQRRVSLRWTTLHFHVAASRVGRRACSVTHSQASPSIKSQGLPGS